MSKVNYSFMWMMATMAGDTKGASEIMQTAITDVGMKLTAVVNSFTREDLPIVAATMKVSAEGLMSMLDGPAKGMAEMIASKTQTQVLDLDELRKQTSGKDGKDGK